MRCKWFGTFGMSSGEITQLLEASSTGDTCAANALFRNVYQELRVIAQSQRRRWKGNETLNTTALIHEAYVKLADAKGSYKNRTHFYATASRAMRQVLVNYAERSKADKRSAEYADIKIEEIARNDGSTIDELLAIDGLLKQLANESERRCQIVECRVFGGMSIEETAEALNVSPATVKRDWVLLSAWLYRELKGNENPANLPND